jgi:glycoside/pentoside/hexuronide:cation symporter, GPH family
LDNGRQRWFDAERVEIALRYPQRANESGAIRTAPIWRRRKGVRLTKKVATLSQWAFACSGIPTTGIISTGIDYFLFFFYSQVVGLSAALTGLALAIALTFDAVFNPLMGYFSDHWRSRLGRRLPFMYASILPLTALYVLVWYPPAGAPTQWILFGYLLTLMILLRLSMAMFDAPVRTLVAELTPDYDERTRLASLPTSASWFIGSVMTIAIYAIWLKDTPEHVIGQTNIMGYQQAAIACGAVILASLLFSTVGLHPEIPRLHMRAPEQTAGLREMVRSFDQLLQNRSMRALLLSSLFVGTGLGATASLWVYQYGFFYGMRSEQMSMLTVVEALASFAVAPVIRRYVVKGDKKVMAIRFLIASVAISMILPPLLCLHWLPERGSRGLWYLLTSYDFLSQLLWIVTASIVYSLYADVTDDVVLRIGKRLEGAIFACQTFVERVATACGALIAGLLLTMIHYPTAADNSRISAEVLARLGLSYMGVWFVFVSIGIWFLSSYEITRSMQAAEVEVLERSDSGTQHSSSA